LSLAERCLEAFLANSGAAPSTYAREQAASRPAAAPDRLPLGAAVLVIAGISAALWLGIARLIAALF
jgi:hypothetical protein